MSRSTWTLIAVLIVLVGIALIVLRRPGEHSTAGTSGEKVLTFDSSAVDRMEILSHEGHVVLQKEHGSWVQTAPARYRADQSVVKAAIARASSMEIKSIVSSNPAKQQIFQVDSNGTLVRLFSGDNLLGAFRVGKPSSTFTDTYVRREGSDDVILVDGMFNVMFTRSPKDWRERTILNVAPERVHNIRFHYGDTVFALSRKDSLWMLDGRPALQNAVQGFLTSLAGLSADGFLDSVMTVQPALRAVLDVDGIRVSFFNGANPGTLRVQTSASPQWFEIQEWKANGVLKRKADFAENAKK